MTHFQSALTYRNLRLLFYLLLLTAAAYLASNLLIFYTELKLVNHVPRLVDQPLAPPAKNGGMAERKDYRILLERNLFGIRLDSAPAPSKKSDLLGNIDKLGLTTLNCTLVGTVIQENGQSWAIIRDNQTSKDEKVSPGGTISGAKVMAILRNKVVLNSRGKDELLVMGIERIRSGKGTQEKPSKENAQAGSFTLSRELVVSSINDLPKIMNTVRIRPFLKDGKPQGFRISNLKEESFLKTMGFQNGDIIKGVNGQEIHSPEDMMKLYNNLKDSSSFTVTLMRNNRLETLNYTVN